MVIKCTHCGQPFIVRADSPRTEHCPTCGLNADGATHAARMTESSTSAGKSPSVHGESHSHASPRRGDFISPRLRGSTAILLLVAFCFCCLLAIFAREAALDLLDQVKAGQTVLPGETARVEKRIFVAGLGLAAFGILSGAGFLVWEYRAYRNLASLGAKQLRFSPAGSAGWYFCPILNLWKPVQAMEDIWKGSREGRPAFALVFVWWALIIISGLVTNISMWKQCQEAAWSGLTNQTGRLDQTISMLNGQIVVLALCAAAGICTIALIWNVNKGQLKLAERGG